MATPDPTTDTSTQPKFVNPLDKARQIPQDYGIGIT